MAALTLEDRTAIVTGSGRGIGRAIALELADGGANVVVTARTGEEVDATVADVRETTPGSAIGVRGDILDSEHVDRLFESAAAEFGSLDVLVNNAGGTVPFDVTGDSMADYRDAVALNLDAAVECALRAARTFDGREPVEEVTGGAGNILTISSIHSRVAGQTTFPYNVAKAGLEAMTRALAISLAPADVLVNAIAPGFVDTAGSSFVGTERFRETYLESGRVPQARAADPEEIARVARFVVSPENTYMTGQTLVVDGGATVTL